MFLQEADLQVCWLWNWGSAEIHDRTNTFGGLRGILHPLERVCVAKAKLWQMDLTPQAQGSREQTHCCKSLPLECFLSNPVTVLAIDDKRMGLNF